MFGIDFTIFMSRPMTRLSEIDDQIASSLACDHLICQGCGVVDRDHSRMRVGSRCSTCNAESESGCLYFPISIHILVDLAQQAYHSTAPVGPLDGPQAQGISTILFFCALREALLNRFLFSHLRAQRVPERLIEKLLDDNKLASQKFGDLFSSVVGSKWDVAVDDASKHTGRNFQAVSELMKQAASIRNEFLHEGTAWSASYEVATECVDAMPSLVALFVSLHNVYIHPLVRKS